MLITVKKIYNYALFKKYINVYHLNSRKKARTKEQGRTRVCVHPLDPLGFLLYLYTYICNRFK